MATQQINPRNAIMFLLQREFFRECERGETTKDGEKYYTFTHPDGISFEEWLKKHNCAVEASPLVNQEGNQIFKP